MIGRASLVLIVALGALTASRAPAQQTTVGGPHPVAGHSYYEHFGTSWGIRGNGWFFQFGGGGAVPPFGGFDPNAGANFGFAGPNGFLNISAGQGSNTTFSGQTPMVTVMNGGTGAFFDQTLRPFVTGITPVVGGQPPVFGSVLHERLSRLEAGEAGGAGAGSSAGSAPGSGTAKGSSSAERGELSVAEIKARKAASNQSADATATAEIDVLLEKARGAIAAGKPGVAKIHLQMAARRATGEQQAAIQKQIDELSAVGK